MLTRRLFLPCSSPDKINLVSERLVALFAFYLALVFKYSEKAFTPSQRFFGFYYVLMRTA